MPNPFGEERQPSISQLRLVPEIERSARLQALVATPFGRVLLSIAFVAILISFGTERTFLKMSWIELLAVFCIGVVPGPVLWRILFGIVLVYFAGPRRNFEVLVTRRDQLNEVSEHLLKFNETVGANLPFYSGCALVLFLLIAWISLRALRAMQTSLPIFWLFVSWCAFAAALTGFPGLQGSYLGWMTFGLFSVCLFSLGYFASTYTREKHFPTWTTFTLQTLVMSPPFTVLRHPSLLTNGTRKVSREVCQLKALKLLAWSRVLALLQEQMWQLVFVRLGWVQFNQIGLSEYNAHHFSWYQVLLTRVAQTLLLLLGLSVQTGIGISIFRLGGVYLPRAVCRPYLARSFNEYFRRSLYYYSETILHLFFFPIYEKIYPLLARRRWRLQVALFVSLFIGGWIFHVVITWQYLWFFGAGRAVENAIGWLPYFALVGTACCLSATGWISGRMQSAPLALHFALNLLLHSFILGFMQYSLGESLIDRIGFVRAMVPF